MDSGFRRNDGVSYGTIMPMAAPLPDLTGLSLAEIARLAAEAKLPPVESWNPAHCGDSEMRIARDGTWYHQGSPASRPAMVGLFSPGLRRDPDGAAGVRPREAARRGSSAGAGSPAWKGFGASPGDRILGSFD